MTDPQEIEDWSAEPERIWKWPGGGSFTGSTCYPEDHEGLNTEGLTPYVRADLFDALTAERDALREALKRLVTIYEAEQDPDALVRPAWLKDVLEYNSTSDQKTAG